MQKVATEDLKTAKYGRDFFFFFLFLPLLEGGCTIASSLTAHKTNTKTEGKLSIEENLKLK